MLEERDLEFMRVLWSRRVVVTYILLAFNIVIFLLMEFAGGTTNPATLIAFGVKSNPLIDQGEIWRFITPIFIHIGLLHLFFNSYALWMVGPQVEKLYGPARFFILYVLTGVAGVLGSYWYHPEAVSAGASGAIFGLFGALLVFGLKYRSSIPPFFQKAVGAGVLPVIVINLIIGFSIPGIDNAAHIGGLISGALLAAIVPYERPGTSPHGLFKVVQAALLLLIVASFYQVVAKYNGPRISFGNLSSGLSGALGSKSSIQTYIDAVNKAQQAFDSSAREVSSGRTDGMAAAKAELTSAIDELNDVPSIGERADETSSGLLDLAQKQYELLEDIERSGTITFSHGRRADENARRYSDLMESFSEWVEQEGKQYGIQLRKEP